MRGLQYAGPVRVYFYVMFPFPLHSRQDTECLMDGAIQYFTVVPFAASVPVSLAFDYNCPILPWHVPPSIGLCVHHLV